MPDYEESLLDDHDSKKNLLLIFSVIFVWILIIQDSFKTVFNPTFLHRQLVRTDIQKVMRCRV